MLWSQRVSFVLMWRSPATWSEPSDVGWRCVWNEYVGWVIVTEGLFERKKKRDASALYIHGSMHRESNLITVQQVATVFSSLYFCRQLYMFRVLTPIIRSWYSCNYSCTSFCWWVSTPETCRAACRNIIIWIQSHIVGQLLNTLPHISSRSPCDCSVGEVRVIFISRYQIKTSYKLGLNSSLLTEEHETKQW